MSTAQELLKGKVAAFMEAMNGQYGKVMEQPDALRSFTIESLQLLAQDFGTSDYGFNLAMERFVERFCSVICAYLPEILSQSMPSHTALPTRSGETDLAFVAYYAMSLIFKKEDKVDGLKSLLDERYNFFCQLYPLTFEVRSRYYKRIHEYDNALEADELAIEYLKIKGITNYALCISYASTVCRMYEKGYTVENYQCDDAWQYIQAAIEFNPQYPKYHYLKGKLAFYSKRGQQKPEEFQATCTEAIECIRKARALQMEQPGVHFEAALKEYSQLVKLITQESRNRADQSLPFIHFSEQQLRDNICNVMKAQDKKDCLPPNPNLKPGQKYVFISYAHRDFRPVYCDLFRLYAKKIPFQYDGGISKGTRWDQEVHKYINREECLGVLFFVSQNTLLSEAVETECKLMLEAQKSGKNYFCVNLEGDVPPSQIVIQSILTNGMDMCEKHKVDHERIMTFLKTFHDKTLFLVKPPKSGPDGCDHITELIESMETTFPGLKALDSQSTGSQ